MSDSANTLPQIVIVGAGFGGLWAASALAGAPAQVTVIDERNYHLFQPLLYQVGTAGLSAPSIAAPLRQILRKQANITVMMDEARAVDTTARCVHLGQGDIGYDYLIVGTGATHAYFGHDD